MLSPPLNSLALASAGIISFLSILGLFHARQLAQQLKQKLHECEQALHRKNVQLKETNHRVKNSLQSIASLLKIHMQSSSADALKEASTCIQAISRLHEKLYQGADDSLINIAEYFQSLCDDIQLSAPHYTLRFQAESFNICADVAAQVGLIFMEMVNNALKHAHPPAHQRFLDISISADLNNRVKLVVRDYGKGLPYGFSLNDERPSLGVKVMRDMALQIQGKIDAKNLIPGTAWELSWPLSLQSKACSF